MQPADDVLHDIEAFRLWKPGESDCRKGAWHMQEAKQFISAHAECSPSLLREWMGGYTSPWNKKKTSVHFHSLGGKKRKAIENAVRQKCFKKKAKEVKSEEQEISRASKYRKARAITDMLISCSASEASDIMNIVFRNKKVKSLLGVDNRRSFVESRQHSDVVSVLSTISEDHSRNATNTRRASLVRDKNMSDSKRAQKIFSVSAVDSRVKCSEKETS